ncbi:hypothetical protein EYF80_052736 [Liparis tanakae]|uniref:Uncharacterized protein n=1 Tax=Liparis tanakae TaxID=230148 RepID=A0A4Z2F7W2_9TELE|nr:hypothetical protein EYF80_052736 [Liparis tanakae]
MGEDGDEQKRKKTGDRRAQPPDRLLTSIPGGDNHTNTCKWRSTLMPFWEEEVEAAAGTRPFKPISSPR